MFLVLLLLLSFLLIFYLIQGAFLLCASESKKYLAKKLAYEAFYLFHFVGFRRYNYDFFFLLRRKAIISVIGGNMELFSLLGTYVRLL